MNSRLLTRQELVKDIISNLLSPGTERDQMIRHFNICEEQSFIDLCGLKLKRIRKNLYYI